MTCCSVFSCWSHINPAALTTSAAVTTAVTSTATTTITAVQILSNGLSFPELLHIKPGFSQDVSEGTFGDNWSSFIQAGCCWCRPNQQCQTAEITDADQVKSSRGRHPFFCCQLKGRYTAASMLAVWLRDIYQTCFQSTTAVTCEL